MLITSPTFITGILCRTFRPSSEKKALCSLFWLKEFSDKFWFFLSASKRQHSCFYRSFFPLFHFSQKNFHFVNSTLRLYISFFLLFHFSQKISHFVNSTHRPSTDRFFRIPANILVFLAFRGFRIFVIIFWVIVINQTK